jgi:hypothetical protein
MKLILWLLGLIVVGGGALVGLAMMDAPAPACAQGVVANSKAAEDSFNTKWRTFESSVNQAGAGNVIFTKEEVSSRAAAFVLEKNVPAQNVQVHLCQGAGKGEATAKFQVSGISVNAVVAGHVDAAGKKIVVDSLQLGRVPEQIATPLANTIIDLASVQVPAIVKQAASTSAQVTLTGQK